MPMPRMLVPALLLAGCSVVDPVENCYPDQPVAPDGVLSSTEHVCGFWLIGVDGHVYTNVFVSAAGVACDVTMDDGLLLNADPMFSNFDDGEGPKWTFDFVGDEPGDHRVEVLCEDGTEWLAKIRVDSDL